MLRHLQPVVYSLLQNFPLFLHFGGKINSNPFPKRCFDINFFILEKNSAQPILHLKKLFIVHEVSPRGALEFFSTTKFYGIQDYPSIMCDGKRLGTLPRVTPRALNNLSTIREELYFHHLYLEDEKNLESMFEEMEGEKRGFKK